MPNAPHAGETQLLVELVAKVKSLNSAVAQELGPLELKCPCGKVILPPTPHIPSLKDRQRGLLKSRIREHLRSQHGILEQTVRAAIREAFTQK
jgi:hypothetical protein